MIKVSTTGMAVSLKTDLRFPISGQWGHGDRIIQPMWLCPVLLIASFVFGIIGGIFGKALLKKHFKKAGIV